MQKKKGISLYGLLVKHREIGLMAIILLLLAVVGLRNPLFLAPSKLLFIVEDTAIMAILAAGMLCVMLVGSIDISIAGIMALSAMVTGVIMRANLGSVEITQMVDGVETAVSVATSLPLPVLVLIGMAIGAVCGLVNGALIAYGNVLSIIATLGMQYVFFGLAHFFGAGSAIYKKDMSDDFINFTRWEPLGIDFKIWIMLAVFILLFIFITYFRAGRHLYAVGSNREAAEMRGVHAKRTILIAHIIMGALAGLAGLMYGSHDTKVTQDLAEGYEMYVIAACVIGGVSVTGGSGRIWSVLLGALTIGVINNGLTMMKLTGEAEFWKKTIQGTLILVAVISNVLLQRSMNKQNLLRRNI